MRTIERTRRFKRDYKREAKGKHRATLATWHVTLPSPPGIAIFRVAATFGRAGSLMASDVASPLISKDSVTTITVVVRRLPEGVWLATSDDLPGLIVETATREEAIDLSPELALELLSENEAPSETDRPKFVFAFP